VLALYERCDFLTRTIAHVPRKRSAVLCIINSPISGSRTTFGRPRILTVFQGSLLFIYLSKCVILIMFLGLPPLFLKNTGDLGSFAISPYNETLSRAYIFITLHHVVSKSKNPTGDLRNIIDLEPFCNSI